MNLIEIILTILERFARFFGFGLVTLEEAEALHDEWPISV